MHKVFFSLYIKFYYDLIILYWINKLVYLNLIIFLKFNLYII